MRGQITHTSLRFRTGVKTSSVHMNLNFGCISKRPNILMEMYRHFISSNVYMTFYHPKWTFIFVKMTDIKSMPALSFKRTYTLNATFSWSENLIQFEISFQSKWSIFQYLSPIIKCLYDMLAEMYSECCQKSEPFC